MTQNAPKFFADEFANVAPLSTLVNEGVSYKGVTFKMNVVVDLFKQQTYFEIFEIVITSEGEVPTLAGKFYTIGAALHAFRVAIKDK